MSVHSKEWSRDSWKSMPIHEQGIAYPDMAHLNHVLQRLAELPPLVSPASIESAREQHAAAARGEAFLLVGGDCAESFDDIKTDIISQKVSLLANQANHIEAVTGLPVHVTGRMAGQYSKPRSQLIETLADGRRVSAFRGHNINGPDIADREPDPQRLLPGYWHSVAIMHVLSTAEKVHTAHEALHLPMEAALTKDRSNTSATFLWVGERTRQLDGAHLEYVRGLRNPIGVKIGPSTSPADLLNTLGRLCYDREGEEGRVTIITRFGAEKVGAVLPALVEAVRASPFRPVWMCDPCHGNGFTKSGVKTRKTTTLLSEVAQTIRILDRFGAHLGGLHLEQTGEEVTECVGPESLVSDDLGKHYTSLCDPRLSGTQAMWLVERVAEIVVESRDSRNELEQGNHGMSLSQNTLIFHQISTFFVSWIQMAKSLWRISIDKCSFKSKGV
ncbi:class II DAHP synthetase family protein [Mytilinidion resinicola]|uniref:Phospho-2-dehydro-3-deoxyheptonate aldolase n=1 Tax=Mytilinidion resinicola TaxID=574789 RepID=A0A6A6YBF0_9PEZI|nr:class II DAHP synthetase family protein [Mytilinidion resinicola]KAF2806141.1 class II DAHP synthetase family protein [Mytilinidion resinicola]